MCNEGHEPDEWKHNVGMVEFGEVVQNKFSGENLISTEARVQRGSEAGRGRNGTFQAGGNIRGTELGWRSSQHVWRKSVRTQRDWLDHSNTGEEC